MASVSRNNSFSDFTNVLFVSSAVLLVGLGIGKIVTLTRQLNESKQREKQTNEENELLKKKFERLDRDLNNSYMASGALFIENRFLKDKLGPIPAEKRFVLKPVRIIMDGDVINSFEKRLIGVYSFKDFPKNSQSTQIERFIDTIKKQALIINRQKQQIEDLQTRLNLEEPRTLPQKKFL